MDETGPWLSLLGHLLTAVAVLISALGLRREWRDSRESKAREERNRFTIAAATSLAKLERRRQHYLDYFLHAKPHFITASDQLTRGDLWAPVRDALWKELESEHGRTLGALAQEEIEVAYVSLAAFDPALFAEFRRTLAELDRLAGDEFLALRDSSQKRLSELRDQPTSVISSALRKAGKTHAEHLASTSDALLANVRERILSLVQDPAKIPLQAFR